MNEDILNGLKNSQFKKKKLVTNSDDPNIFKDERNTIPSDYFISNLVIRNFFRERYFDSTKKTHILAKINKDERNILLNIYKKSLIEKIYPTNTLKNSCSQAHDKQDIYSSLSTYIKKKFSYDKTKFKMDSKFYKVSSNLNLQNLKNYLENENNEYVSLMKYSAIEKIPYHIVRKAVKKTLNYSYKVKNI